MSKNDDFIKIFMYFNAKTAQKHIEPELFMDQYSTK